MDHVWYDHYCVICGNGFNGCHTLDIGSMETVMLYDIEQDERLCVCHDCISDIQKVINERFSDEEEN